MEGFKIEKGIERNEKFYLTWPFRGMEVGDSFLIPMPKDPYEAVLINRRVYTATSQHKRREGDVFTVEFNREGWRVFKISNGNK